MGAPWVRKCSEFAIVWSFLSRRQGGVVLPEVPILSPDISRQTTEFQYTEHKRGKTVPTVYAETSTQTVSQVHTLQKVTFTYYDEGEEPSSGLLSFPDLHHDVDVGGTLPHHIDGICRVSRQPLEHR